MPKPIIAMVAGYAVGGGHVLHLLCDLTIAANNADILVYLVAHDEFKNLDLDSNKVVLDFCGIRNRIK